MKAKHPLHDPSKEFAEVRFIHSDGQEHRFTSYVNDLTGDRLTAFDGNAPTIGHTVGEVREVCRNIHAKAQVLEFNGTLAQP